MRYKTSRNKDIDLLHELTKKLYKWDLTETWIHWVVKENCGGIK